MRNVREIRIKNLQISPSCSIDLVIVPPLLFPRIFTPRIYIKDISLQAGLLCHIRRTVHVQLRRYASPCFYREKKLITEISSVQSARLGNKVYTRGRYYPLFSQDLLYLFWDPFALPYFPVEVAPTHRRNTGKVNF